MPLVYVFTTSPWPKEAIPLGSIVPDREYPHEDIIRGIETKVNEDYEIVTRYDFSGIVDTDSTKQGTLAALWDTICSILWGVEARGKVEVSARGRLEISAREARHYSLLQPLTIFEKMCQCKKTREFLRKCWRDGITPAFVTGYQTLLDAKMEHTDQRASVIDGSGNVGNVSKPDGTVQHTVGARQDLKGDHYLEYRTEDEAIYAINYRKILIKVHHNDGVDASLKRFPNSWVVSSQMRGKPAEEEVMQASLDDSAAVEEGDSLVFEDDNGRYFKMPSIED